MITADESDHNIVLFYFMRSTINVYVLILKYLLSNDNGWTHVFLFLRRFFDFIENIFRIYFNVIVIGISILFFACVRLSFTNSSSCKICDIFYNLKSLPQNIPKFLEYSTKTGKYFLCKCGR